MQEVFICCTRQDRARADAIVAASLENLDNLRVEIEVCGPGETVVDACSAAGDADGVLLLLSPDSVPREATRESWGPVLDRLTRKPESVAAVELEPCEYPRLLAARDCLLARDEPRALRRWAIALDNATAADRFLVAPSSWDASQQHVHEVQFDYRDVIWIPCLNRSAVAVQADINRARAETRCVLPVLDRPRPRSAPDNFFCTTPASLPAAEPLNVPGPIRQAIAVCRRDYLDRDFCAAVAQVDPQELSSVLPPLTADRRILRVPQLPPPSLLAATLPRRRHAQVLENLLTQPSAVVGENELVIRLELPCALQYLYENDWNAAAALAWRACRVLRDRWPAECAEHLMRLWQSASDHGVRSWMQLTEEELRWYGQSPSSRGKSAKPRPRQLELDW